jgi:PadR family transcriptional regulator, regulatory protein PadR
MPSKEQHRVEILQGTLDLIILRILAGMGPQHSYGIASRLEQISQNGVSLNQGTLYPALVRLEQNGWISARWRTTEKNREAKYYRITKSGQQALEGEIKKWRRSVGLIERLLLEG